MKDEIKSSKKKNHKSNSKKVVINTKDDLNKLSFSDLKNTKIFDFSGKFFDFIYDRALGIEKNPNEKEAFLSSKNYITNKNATNKSQKSKQGRNKKINQKQSEKISKISTEKTAVINGEIELDQAVEDIDRYRIVSAKPSEYPDKYYAVTLNYTNVQNNNNKFYIIQLLQDIHTKKYGVLYRWGRIGFFGQVNYVIYETFEEAREAFITKLQGKLEYGYIKIKMEAKIKEDQVFNSVKKKLKS